MGTSLDGVNLYKGNNAGVLALYSAYRGASLDATEASLFEGNITLDSAWVENDYAMTQTRLYVRARPVDTLRATVRKASVFFLGVRRDLGEEPYPRLIELDFDVGLLIFRLMLIAALTLALWNLFAVSGSRFPAIVFLGCVALPRFPT